MEEIEANQDLLRAEFAMSACRFEKRLPARQLLVPAVPH